MLPIALSGTGIHSLCIQLRESTVCNRLLIHYFPVHFVICVSVVTVYNGNKIPSQLQITL